MPSDRRPGPLLFATEGVRSGAELGAFVAAAGPLVARSARGDGHDVLVLPGFTADDTSTRPLRWFLRQLGYRTHRWRLGLNLGPTDRVIDGLLARFEAVTDGGRRPVSLVGWSLGGIYARELARVAPDPVRQVITLGSPFRLADPEVSNASPLYDVLSTFHSNRIVTDTRADQFGEPMPVPTTAIYTRGDGIVPWRATMEPDGPRSESIAVRGSHCGLGHNPATLRILADRLAQPAGAWAPYKSGAAQRAALASP